MLPYENKYWSIKEHFLPAGNRYKSSSDNEYTTKPIEIDAEASKINASYYVATLTLTLTAIE